MVQNTCYTAKTNIVFVKLSSQTFSHAGQSEYSTERLIVFKPAICAGGTTLDLFLFFVCGICSFECHEIIC